MSRSLSTTKGVCFFAMIVLAIYLAGVTQASSREVSFSALLEQMVNLDWLAQVPTADEHTAQFSSYDRASQVIDGAKISWFANGDLGKYLETRSLNGRQEAVLAKIDGPGSIVRIWSANPQGILRIYLDNNSDPVVEVPFASAVSGTWVLPFTEPFAGTRARGANIYFPFPFQKSAIVTVENPGRMYYHINYVQFPREIKVEAYSRELLTKYKEQISEVAERLKNPYQSYLLADSQAQTLSLRLAPGDRQVIRLAGPAAITSLEMKMQAADLEKALRETLLIATWDGQTQPSIWSPLGDFFGGSPGLNPYSSLPLGILKDGTMYSRWYMPFANSASIEIVNEGNQTVEITGSLYSKPIEWSNNLAYFHAKWRQDSVKSSTDWQVLNTDGAGRFVGLMLSVMNPVFPWWGEGDEKIYVNNENFPSTFGTGTEDYFGYAWCNPTVFSHAYHSQPRADGPRNFGHIINARFQIIDNIAYQQNIRFDLEVLHHVPDAALVYAGVAYWYSTGNADNFTPYPLEKRGIPETPMFKPLNVLGAIEGEKLGYARVSRGTSASQDMTSFTSLESQWSGDAQLWWRGGNVGDTLRLSIPIKQDGKYRISGRFTKAKDYGKVEFAINGTKLGSPIDFYDPNVVPTDELGLGTVELKQGTAEIQVTIIGTNPRATNRMFGLDYFKVELEN